MNEPVKTAADAALALHDAVANHFVTVQATPPKVYEALLDLRRALQVQPWLGLEREKPDEDGAPCWQTDPAS